MNELTLTQELTGLSDSKAAQVKAVFQPMVKMLEGFESVYSDVMSEEQTQEKSEKAKSLRLDIAKVRIKADKARKAQKEECLREGNAIQGVYNVLKFAIADKEEKLREVETHYDRIEEERIEKVQAERASTLAKYDVVTSNPHLGVMADEVWVNYLSGVKQNYEAIKEAERKTEEERIEKERKVGVLNERNSQILPYAHLAEFGDVGFGIDIHTTQAKFNEILSFLQNKKKEHENEQARIKQENEKLKAEQVKLQKEREERETELAREREERAKIERENQEKKERQAEEKRKFELAPDKEKLLNLAHLLSIAKDTTNKDRMKFPESKKALSQAINILTTAANKM